MSCRQLLLKLRDRGDIAGRRRLVTGEVAQAARQVVRRSHDRLRDRRLRICQGGRDVLPGVTGQHLRREAAIIMLDIFGVYQRMKKGNYNEAELDHKLTAGGLMTRIFGRLFKVIRAS